MKIKYIQGDLIIAGKNRDIDVLVHGCNCFCKMSAGIADAIKKTFPGAYEVDCKTIKGDRKKLGSISIYKDSSGLEIVNAYTQFTYWDVNDMLSYEAIYSCMKNIEEIYSNKKIGFPLIGCGLAGGDWEKVVKIIESIFKESSNDIFIYLFKK